MYAEYTVHWTRYSDLSSSREIAVFNYSAAKVLMLPSEDDLEFPRVPKTLDGSGQIRSRPRLTIKRH